MPAAASACIIIDVPERGNPATTITTRARSAGGAAARSKTGTGAGVADAQRDIGGPGRRFGGRFWGPEAVTAGQQEPVPKVA
jgi:hypothetical protein